MDLSQYVESVRKQLADASSLADEQTQHMAQKLSTSLESALRLSLIQALSDAAVEISAELAPTTVQVRMDGTEPEFVVQQGPTDTADDAYAEVDDDTEDDADDFLADSDVAPARISLRLGAPLKDRIDEAANEEQISTNAWITRALHAQLRRRARRGARDERRGRRGHRRGGWSDSFGPHEPFGPGGPFGPNGPFGPGRPGPEGPRPIQPGPPMSGGWGSGRQRFQGWV